ncbi:hypothetical protein JXR93_01385 [bacterium]|nr:hypothetical protein [bacterium]
MRLFLISILFIIAFPVYCKTVENQDKSESDKREIINKIIEEKLAIVNREICVNDSVTIITKVTSEQIAFNLNIKF